MAKKSKAIRRRKFCYVCKEWIEWWEHPEADSAQNKFHAEGHYDKSKLEELSRKAAAMSPTLGVFDLRDHHIKGVSKSIKRELKRIRSI